MHRWLVVLITIVAASFVGVPPASAGDAPIGRLDSALTNAPARSTIHGGVYWDVQRDPVSYVMLLDKKTGVHLAQWNL
jgi:hypothetical protein